MDNIKTTYIFGNQKKLDVINATSTNNIINIDTNRYSNYFILRKFYNIISHKNFDKSSTHFVFEFIDNLSIELFFKPLNKYITINIDNDMNIFIDGNHDESSYEYDIMKDHLDIFNEFIDNLYDVDNEIKQLHRYLILFITYLNHNDFKYSIINLPFDMDLPIIKNYA